MRLASSSFLLLGILAASVALGQDGAAPPAAPAGPNGATGNNGGAGSTTDEELREEVRTLTQQLQELRAASDQEGLDMLQHFGVGLSLASDLDDAERVGAASLDPNGIVRVDADRNVRAGVILEFHSLMFCEKLDFDDPDYRPADLVPTANPPADQRVGAQGGGVPQGQEVTPALQQEAVTRRQRREQQEQAQKQELQTPTYRQHITEPTYRAVERAGNPPFLKQVPPCNRNRRAMGFFVAVQPGSDELIDAVGAGWMWRWPDKLRLGGERVLNIGIGLISDPNVDELGDGFVENEKAPLDPNGVPQQVRLKKTDRTGWFITASVEVGR